MKFDLCPGDDVLVLHLQTLGYGGVCPVALKETVTRVTPTQVIIGKDRYRKEDGGKMGGRGELLDPNNPTYHGSPVEVMTVEEARSLYTEWSLFESELRSVLGRQAPSYGIGNLFCNKDMRKEVLDEARRHEDTIMALYKKYESV